MEIGKPNKTNAPAENHAMRCGSVPFSLSSRLYHTTPMIMDTTLPQRRMRAKKFITETVVRRRCEEDSRHNRFILPHPIAAAGPPDTLSLLPEEEDESSEVGTSLQTALLSLDAFRRKQVRFVAPILLILVNKFFIFQVLEYY